MRYLTSFAAFWYDFIVGDSVVLAIGGVAVLMLGALMVDNGLGAAAEVALPAIVVGTLALSLRK